MGKIVMHGKIVEAPGELADLPVTKLRPLRATNGLSVAIMAHRRRRKFIPYLLERLGDVPVIWDGSDDRWETGHRAMAAYEPGARHHLVVQDDAILSIDFLAGVREVLRHVPFGPVCFYMGQITPYPFPMQRAIQRALQVGARYLSMRGPHWGVAIAVPTVLIADMLHACQRISVPNYDNRIERFFTIQGISCTYTLPSLVNHRVGRTNPSLVPGRGNSNGRTAYRFTDERSALEYDWCGDSFDVATVDSNQDPQNFKRRAARHGVVLRDERGRPLVRHSTPVPEPDLEAFTVPDLRQLAAVRGVDIAGITRKADLVALLREAPMERPTADGRRTVSPYEPATAP